MNIETYEIDISTPNGKCFNELVLKYKKSIQKVILKLKCYYENYLSYIKLGINAYILQGGIIMYKDEILEISKILEITFEECLMMQLTYEFFSACTTAVKYQYDIKDYILVRTMDWDLPELKDITVKLIFKNSSVHHPGGALFEAIGWAGCVGIFTGIKRADPEIDSYAIALNYRRTLTPDIKENIAALFKGYFPCSFYLRKILSEKESCANVSLESLQKVFFVAPCYLTILKRGKEILQPSNPKLSTRQYKNDSYILIRGRTNYKIKKGDSKFLIQTNIDDVSPSSACDNILYSKERYTHMSRLYIGKILQNLNGVISHIEKFPVTNEETIYKCIMTTKEFLYIDV